MTKEAYSRVQIDKLLHEAGWILLDSDGKRNVNYEVTNKAGAADYVLLDSYGNNLATLEAKAPHVNPLVGKEQARKYAEDLKTQYIILSNGSSHYLWDIKIGNPQSILTFPSPNYLQLTKEKLNKTVLATEEIGKDYLVKTQYPSYEKSSLFTSPATKEKFVTDNNLKFLRDYQLNAILAVSESVRQGNSRFLLEMATGTGKTLVSAGMMKMFFRNLGVKRCLFLVDRLELEDQAYKAFVDVLSNDFETVIWKDNKSTWNKAEIVVSTIQSFTFKNKYKRLFKPDDFDALILDESHRSVGTSNRRVIEYFVGYKLGLTATPKDYLKSIDVEKLSLSDPRQLEKRQMLDTYTIFGCENSEPTFRYSLVNGVRDGYLVNPKVIDIRSDVTTQLLSDEGYVFSGLDEDGNETEETFRQKDFEKKFFSSETNQIICETFLKNAQRDPFPYEIGKTLIVCVSQEHAAKVTQILNELAHSAFSGKYSSDFAIQVTSNVMNSQRMTVEFRNNNLNGHSIFEADYRTSKARVCVTVGMMATGYDCPDILNVCLIRPIFSASDFIQMKGRGTRKNNFNSHWIDKTRTNDSISEKKMFSLFDYFGNYEYFERDFEYDEKLKLPSLSTGSDGGLRPTGGDVVISNLDPLKSLKEFRIPDAGMRVDRDLYKKFKTVVSSDKSLEQLMANGELDEAERYIKEHILDKSSESFTLEKLQKVLDIDRKINAKDLLLYAFGHIDRIKNLAECLEEEFEKFDDTYLPDENIFADVKETFEAYTLDKTLRSIIETKKYAELNVHPAGEAFKKIPKDYKAIIPDYINKNLDFTRFISAR